MRLYPPEDSDEPVVARGRRSNAPSAPRAWAAAHILAMSTCQTSCGLVTRKNPGPAPPSVVGGRCGNRCSAWLGG